MTHIQCTATHRPVYFIYLIALFVVKYKFVFKPLTELNGSVESKAIYYNFVLQLVLQCLRSYGVTGYHFGL